MIILFHVQTNFEPSNNENVINKGYQDEKLKKIVGHISFIEKDYNEFKLQYNKQSVEEVLVQRAIKTTIQVFYDKGLFDNYANADKVLADFFTTRRRAHLEEVNDDIQGFCSKIQFEKQSNIKIKIQQVLSSLGFSDVGICLKDGPFQSDIGIVNLHPTKGLHWVVYTKENNFDSYGLSGQRNFPKSL